jgi:hypothetical protein
MASLSYLQIASNCLDLVALRKFPDKGEER